MTIVALWIDDEDRIIESLPGALKRMLANNGLEVEINAVKDLENARQQLVENDFHFVIVDLNLRRGTVDGNEIIRQILATKVLPIIVFSGYPHDLDDEFANHGLIHVCEKKQLAELASQIEDWNNQRVFQFFSETGFLGSTLRKVLINTMWLHVSKYWAHLGSSDLDVLTQTAGRIAATILQDELTTSAGPNPGEMPIHHGEIYLLKSARNFLSSGDILRIEGNYQIVLSPACDLIPRSSGTAKAQQVLLAKCHSFKGFSEENETISAQIEKYKDPKSITSQQQAERNLTRLFRQDWENPSGRYFYLPPFAHMSGWVVDYLMLTVLPYNSVEIIRDLTASRQASVNRDVAAEITNRFSRYMLRLGQPSFVDQHLLDSIVNATNTGT